MIQQLVFFFFISSCFAQLFMNDIIFDYPEEQINYSPTFLDYPDAFPDYRLTPYSPQASSYSIQMWNGCGCATAKTYGDYMKSRPRPSNQRLLSYYQLM